MGRLRYWIVPLVWAAVIWTFSTQMFSSASTAGWILPLLHWLFPHASRHALLLLHEVIRKGAHVIVYFIFSLLVLVGVRSGRREWRLSWALMALAIAAAYASLDEIHQAFVPGRGPAVRDVLLDTAAAALAQLWMWWRNHRTGRATAHADS